MLIDIDEVYGTPSEDIAHGEFCDVCFRPLPDESPRRGPKRKRHDECREKRKRDRRGRRR
jgi:hypothetical protein